METKKMKDSEKLDMILNKYQLTYASFARKIRINKDNIYSLKLGKSQNFSNEMLNAILNEFPEINAYWLITGKGEMIESDNDCVSIRQRNFNINNVRTNDVAKQIEMLSDIIKEKDIQIKNLMEQITSLIALLNSKTDQNRATN